MSKPILFVLLLLLVIFLPKHSFPQWDEKTLEVRFAVPEIALIDIEPENDNSISFNVKSTTESGASPTIEKTSENLIWMNYTNSIRGSGTKRKITAEIANGSLPEGFSLFLEASNYSGVGKGKVGTPTNKIRLTNSPKTLITGVGNCFTGDGVNNGHLLNFSMKINDYSKINSSEEVAFTILYTLIDN